MHHQEKLSFCILNLMNLTIFADSVWIGVKTVVVMLLWNHRAKALLQLATYQSISTGLSRFNKAAQFQLGNAALGNASSTDTHYFIQAL